MIAVPAVFGARFVIHFAGVVGILCAFKEIIHEINGVVEIIVVTLADVDVNFSLEFWPKLLPIAPEDVAKVVMLSPVVRHRAIDLPC